MVFIRNKSRMRHRTGCTLKVESRGREGKLIHKSRISTDDPKAIERELRLWKDKLGIPLSTFTNVINKPFDTEEMGYVKALMKKKLEEDQKVIQEAMNNSK